MRKWPKLHKRFKSEYFLTLEASFTSQIITMYIYDAPMPLATRIFDIFLLDGAQVIVDLIVKLLETQYDKIMSLEE